MGESSSDGENAEIVREAKSAEIVWCSFHPSESVAIEQSTFMQQSIELPNDLSGFPQCGRGVERERSSGKKKENGQIYCDILISWRFEL